MIFFPQKQQESQTAPQSIICYLLLIRVFRSQLLGDRIYFPPRILRSQLVSSRILVSFVTNVARHISGECTLPLYIQTTFQLYRNLHVSYSVITSRCEKHQGFFSLLNSARRRIYGTILRHVNLLNHVIAECSRCERCQYLLRKRKQLNCNRIQ